MGLCVRGSCVFAIMRSPNPVRYVGGFVIEHAVKLSDEICLHQMRNIYFNTRVVSRYVFKCVQSTILLCSFIYVYKLCTMSIRLMKISQDELSTAHC